MHFVDRHREKIRQSPMSSRLPWACLLLVVLLVLTFGAALFLFASLHNTKKDISRSLQIQFSVFQNDMERYFDQLAVMGKVQPFRYRGYVFDEETGLYYLRSRYYRAEWCRFLNADVLIEGNLYDYCLNNPIMQNDLMGLESEHATPAPNPPPISSATPTPIAPLIYKVPLFSQGGWSLCWAYCAVMTYCYKNNVTDMTQEEADLMAISFACEYQLDKLQIDAMTIGTCWWNQGGWPADIGTECLARDIGSIYSIRELLESGPVYGYYNGEIETNGARIPDAHLIVVTGVDVNNDIIYTNNPWGYSGEQTFEEFMHGFYMSPYENMPLCSIFQTK